MRSTLLFSLGVLLAFTLPCVVEAEERKIYHFGDDLVGDTESGRRGDGYATARMDFVVDRNQLTAILRNTSPIEENLTSSPAITQLEFSYSDLRDSSGELVNFTNWRLEAYNDTGATLVLGEMGARNAWHGGTSDGTFNLKERQQVTAPLYNPVATVGLKEPSFFTEAHLTVTLDRDVAPLIEGTHHSFAPVIKFEFVGSDSKPVSLRGHTPEPASFVIWGGGLLAAAGICRWRHRRRRKA